MPLPQPPYIHPMVNPPSWGLSRGWLIWFRDLVLQYNAGAGFVLSGLGTPEAVVARSPGYLYLDLTNGKVYQKRSGTDSVGWVEVGSGGGVSPDFAASIWPTGSIASPDLSAVAGVATLNGVVLFTPITYAPPQTLQFTATFSGAAFIHIGFALDLLALPWAIVSAVDKGAGIKLYARSGETAGVEVFDVIDTVFGVSHVYKIEWAAASVKYYIDGVLKATHAKTIPTSMYVAASDLNHDANVTIVSALTLGGTRILI